MDKVLHKFRYLNRFYGRLCVDTNNCAILDVKPLDVSLQHAFNLSKTSILVIGNEMIAVFKNGKDQYGIFDSHSRDYIGMATDNGHAVLLYFTSLQNLVRHLHLLAKSLSLEDSPVLEIKPIAISSTMQGKAVDDISFTSELCQERSSQEQISCSNTQSVPSLSQVHKPPNGTCNDGLEITTAFKELSGQALSKGHESSKGQKRKKKKKFKPKNCKCIHRPGTYIRCRICKILLKRARTLKRKALLKIADPSVIGMSGDKLAMSQEKTLYHCKTKEESEALLLIRDVQKLEKYLSITLPKASNWLTKDPNCSKYDELSILTAAEVIIFNKPRADAVMKLTVQSYNEQITKLNPDDEILQSLSDVEKKLCERLEVMKVPDNEGNLVPILLTPSFKAAMATLVEMRSLVNIDSSNPYLFVKCEFNQDGMTSSTDVLNIVSEKAGLLRNTRVPRHVVHTAARNTGLLNDVRLQNQVATISQLMSMQDNELDWLKSFIADIVDIDSNHLSNLQASTLGMAKVVQMLFSIESGKAHQFAGKDWSQLKLSDVMGLSDDNTQEPMQEEMDTGNLDAGTLFVTEDRHGFQGAHSSDVPSNAGNSTTLEEQEGEDFWSIVDVPSNAGNSTTLEEQEGEDFWSIVDTPSVAECIEKPEEEKYADVLRRKNIPIVTECTDEPLEEKYADVLRRKNIPIVTECTDEPIEEKYADVLRRKNIPIVTECTDEPMQEKYADVLERTGEQNKTEVESQHQKDDKSIINISVDLSSVYEDIYDTGELPEEKYSDVMDRDGMTVGNDLLSSGPGSSKIMNVSESSEEFEDTESLEDDTSESYTDSDNTYDPEDDMNGESEEEETSSYSRRTKDKHDSDSEDSESIKQPLEMSRLDTFNDVVINTRSSKHFSPFNNTKIGDSDMDLRSEDEEVSRDVGDEGLKVKRILTPSTTRTGRKKKRSRVFNIRHSCPFCHNLQDDFSLHILGKMHEAEPEVQKIINIKISKYDSDELKREKDRERKRLITLLRNRGDNDHNRKVFKEKRGKVILARRDAENQTKFSIKNYGPCPMCLEWLKLDVIDRHRRNCPANPKTHIYQTKGHLLIQSSSIAGQLPTKASKKMLKEVYPVMRSDAVGLLARSDSLIIALGNQWFARNVGNQFMHKYYACAVMRLSSRLLMVLRKMVTPSTGRNMEDYLHPSCFTYMARAAIKVAQQDDENEEDLKAPLINALKFSYNIKRMANVKLAQSIQVGDLDKQHSARNFLHLMTNNWSSQLEHEYLEERKHADTKPLPLPEDVIKLNRYLTNEAATCNLADTSYTNFKKIVTLSLASIISYNRRRPGVVQAMKLSSYFSRKSGLDQVSDAGLNLNLTESEKKLLLLEQDVMVIRGKYGQFVPVIIPLYIKHLLEHITDSEVRLAASIPSTNNYIFANQGFGVIRGGYSLMVMSNAAGLTKPERVRGIASRSFMATLSQGINLTPHQQQWVMDHMGHTLDAHNIRYSCTRSETNGGNISKLLLLLESGNIAHFEGKTLEDIKIEEILGQDPQITLTQALDPEPEDEADIEEEYVYVPQMGI